MAEVIVMDKKYVKDVNGAHWLDRYDHISRMLQNLRSNIESSSSRVLVSSEAK